MKNLIIILFMCSSILVKSQSSNWILGGYIYQGNMNYSNPYIDWKFDPVIGLAAELGYKLPHLQIGVSHATVVYNFSRPNISYLRKQYQYGIFVEKDYTIYKNLKAGWQVQPYFRHFYDDFYTASLILSKGNLGLEGGLWTTINLYKNLKLKLFTSYQHDVYSFAKEEVGDVAKLPIFKGFTFGAGFRLN